jgi:P pilus assembly chaperone PapD
MISGDLRRPCGRSVLPVALALLVLFPSASSGQLVVDRLELFLADDSESASGTFTVSNVSGEPVTAQIDLEDWERREDGTNVFLEAGSVAGSCHPDVEIFPRRLLLEPLETQAVRAMYRGPARSTSCWISVRVAAAAQPAPSAGAMRISVAIHQYVKIYVEPAGGWSGIDIVDVDVVPVEREDAPGTFEALATITNPGTVQVLASGVVEYRTLANEVAARSTFPDAPVLPGAVRRMRVPLPELPEGRYVALVLFDTGGSERVAAQIDLEIGR